MSVTGAGSTEFYRWWEARSSLARKLGVNSYDLGLIFHLVMVSQPGYAQARDYLEQLVTREEEQCQKLASLTE